MNNIAEDYCLKRCARRAPFFLLLSRRLGAEFSSCFGWL